jgi:hypothetical protein
LCPFVRQQVREAVVDLAPAWERMERACLSAAERGGSGGVGEPEGAGLPHVDCFTCERGGAVWDAWLEGGRGKGRAAKRQRQQR